MGRIGAAALTVAGLVCAVGCVTCQQPAPRPRSPKAAKQLAEPTKGIPPGMLRQQAGPSSVPSASLPTITPLTGRPDARFTRFLDRLQARTEGRARRVRVSMWGDSHVAGAVLPARLRKRLQERLGDAGPGFVLLGQPWRSYRHLQVKTEQSRRRVVWRAERLWSRYSRRRPRPRDDLLGLAGVSVHTKRSAFARVAPRDREASFAALDLYYLRQPGGGRIVVQTGTRRVRWVLTVASEKEPGFARVELPAGTRQVELVTGSTGEVRLYGADLDSGEPGAVLDAFGINGARASSLLEWNEALMTAQLARLAPDLLVLAYGSNEVDQEGVSPQKLRASFDEVVARLRRVAPGAGCLVLGPPDQARFDRDSGQWRLPTQLEAIIEAQRAVAGARGCAFWDQRAAMGGPGSIFSWVSADPPLARQDHVHLYGEGYRRVADALYEALVQAWTHHRQRQRTPDAVVWR